MSKQIVTTTPDMAGTEWTIPNIALTRQDILLKFNGKAMQSLCDTGTTRSVISADLAKRLQLKVTKSQLVNTFIPEHGHPIFRVGQVSLNVTVQGLNIPSTLYVVNNLHPKLILRNDWLKSTRAVINCTKGVLSLYDY